jgi:hypothetical protein
MFGRSKKKKSDLLEMSEGERILYIKEIREKFQRRIIESKLRRLLLEAENLTINGNVVYAENQQLKGFSLDRTKSEPNFYYVE